MEESAVSIIALDDDACGDILRLRVHPSQSAFIESSADCLSDYRTDAYGIRWTIWGIYQGAELVGFAMHGQEKWKLLPIRTVWLDRFMIDAAHQGKGCGKQALRLLLPRLYAFYNCKRLFLSAIEENTAAIGLYERAGFRKTAFKDPKGERIMVRKRDA